MPAGGEACGCAAAGDEPSLGGEPELAARLLAAFERRGRDAKLAH